VICSKTETRSRGGRAHDREASCLEYSNNHALTRDNSLTLPPYGTVMVSNLSFPGTEIIRYTEKIVSHHRTTLGVSFRSACLSLREINAGSPHVASRDNGKSGSTSLNKERGCPRINRCRATVRALRYLTTKLGPCCRVNLSNMVPNLVKDHKSGQNLRAEKYGAGLSIPAISPKHIHKFSRIQERYHICLSEGA